MSRQPVFISYATADKAFVKDLREALEGHRIPVWVDSRNLRGGDKLNPEIEKAIGEASQVIAVLGPQTVNSTWVRQELKIANASAKSRPGYRVTPLLLPGIATTALGAWFEEEPLAIVVDPNDLQAALPGILAALGERLPTDAAPLPAPPELPLAELRLELQDPAIRISKGKSIVAATATLSYHPPEASTREVKSQRYKFTSALGPIEAGELRWYLEEYYRWPTGLFMQRAEGIEAQLPEWGRSLFQAALGHQAAREALEAWRGRKEGVERSLSIQVDSDPAPGSTKKKKAAAGKAASALLSLPWELLRDEAGYLFDGKHPVRVRRRLPNRRAQPPAQSGLPIRILLASPRPEDEYTGYIDHRASALPLVQAVETLGDLVRLTVLQPPTFAALREALRRAAEAGRPFDVIHFDGHGVYDREKGLGKLCFEHPEDTQKLQDRRVDLVDAEALGALVRNYRVPLVFLEACQTAVAEEEPTASVAARLLEEGVTSVVAMSHAVLVETARRFVAAFYGELARGTRVGKAMLAGQQALIENTWRAKIMGAGELHLQDWFVPVLYQEENDPRLFPGLPEGEVQKLQQKRQHNELGALPETPPQSFIGRSRELLALERLLRDQPYAVIRGQGGAGKTTLAVELARWLVRTGRFRRAAFVSLETVSEARAVLDSLGRQLLPEADGWTVARFPDLATAFQPVARALGDHPTLILLDNLESVLPDPAAGSDPTPAAAAVDDLLALFGEFSRADPAVRLLFTSRESLPAPFDQQRREVGLGALNRNDAIALVGRVMADEGLEPAAEDPGGTPREIEELVAAVDCHARALVLLAREVARRGVTATTEDLRTLMAELHRRHPDDRENSLFASLELSLRRLAPEWRAQVDALAVFHGGAHLYVMAQVLEVEVDVARELAIALIGVGLAEERGYGHLRLDPALPAYLLGRSDAAAEQRLRARWAEAMTALTGYLYEEWFKNAEVAARLTLLELPNLLALLARQEQVLPAEDLVVLADSVETMLANLGRPRALALVVALRERVARKLGAWSHGLFLSQDKAIDRLLDKGDLGGALRTAKQLLEQCRQTGDAAYPAAAYDTAVGHFRIGRVLRMAGNAGAALPFLAESQNRFEALAQGGNKAAERMASNAITERADGLTDMGRWDEAAAAYEEAIRRAEELQDERGIAVKKCQLGTLRMYQKRYADALKAFEEARTLFENLGEHGSVAVAWHQSGMVHKEAGQFEAAERAYRQSLAIRVNHRLRSHEAASLNELGNLYDALGRLEEAVIFYRQAADIYLELGDSRSEGAARNNIADTLIKLKRHDEARPELVRAIVCGQPFGHVAEPWKSWNILYNLEKATGQGDAATEARRKAIASFLAYRRDGGQNPNPGGQLAALVHQAIQQDQTDEATQILDAFLGKTSESWAKALVPKLQAILAGNRDPALAADPDLHYSDAAELQLLLETLAPAPDPPPR